MVDSNINEPLDEFEQSLASLQPSGSGVNRDQLMFLAGRQSAQPAPTWAGVSARLWAASTMISSAAAVVMAVLLAVRPQPQPQTIVKYPPAPAAETPSPQPAQYVVAPSRDTGSDQDAAPPVASYLRLRNQALTMGVDALPLPSRPLQASNEKLATYWNASRELRGEAFSSKPRPTEVRKSLLQSWWERLPVNM